MYKKKKGYVAFLLVCIILTLTFSGLFLATVITVSAEYETDDALFSCAKENTATVYYALDSLGSPYEIWSDKSAGTVEWCSLEDASEYLKQGFIAAEDRDFYRHHGINIKRTVLALINHIFHFKSSFGASTITQQVIKNISGDNERSIKRKGMEILRAMRLESGHSKNEILELYLNIVPMSDNVYGVAGAAELYFGKEASELTLAESATIVGVTNSPARYDPIRHPDAALDKRNRVLYAMLDCGMINESEYKSAVDEPLGISGVPRSDFYVSSWFIETAREDIISELEKAYSISRPSAKMLLRGASVTLTVDEKVQNVLEDYFENPDNLSSAFASGLNYSMAVVDNTTGDLVGIIGRAGSKQGNYLLNLATAPIAPASALKPIALYAPLVDSGEINPASLFEDVPLYYREINGAISAYPKNSPDAFDGDITVAEALYRSKNTVAVKLYEMLGAERIYGLLKDEYGFSELTASDKNAAPLALGQLTNGVSIKKLTEAYGVFTNGGALRNSRSYLSVFSRDGELLLENKKTEKPIMSRDTSMIMTGMLTGVVERGTAARITLKDMVDTAGKTGTSGGDRDRIFVGFTPYYTAGIWCGYADGTTAVGKNSPGHIEVWDGVMKRIHEGCALSHTESLRSFTYSGLAEVKFSRLTGERYCENCENEDALIGYFRFSDMPKEHVCKENGKGKGDGE